MSPLRTPLHSRLEHLGGHRHAWLGLLAFAWLVRLALGVAVLEPEAPPSYDGVYYTALARGLLERGEFAERPGVPTAGRMPGYPLFLAAVAALVGDAPLYPRLVQTVVGATIAVASFLIARALFGVGVGLLAGILAAIDPFLVYYDYRVWSETLAIASGAWGMLAALRAREPAAPRRWAVLAGVLFGVMIYMRPDMVVFVAATAAWLCLLARRERRLLGALALVIAIPAAMLAPWVVRNALVLGRFVPLTTEAGFILWQGSNVETLSGDPAVRGFWVPWPGNPNASWFEVPRLEEDPRFADAVDDEIELDRRFKAEVVAFWRAHAAELPRYLLDKWSHFYRISPAFSFWPQTFIWVSRLWYGPLLASFTVGLVLALVRRAPVGLFVWWLAAFLVRTALFIPTMRYRLQLEPLFIVLAALAAWSCLMMVERYAEVRARSLAPP